MPRNNNYYWKSDVKALFTEILNANSNMWILDKPLKITYEILREGADHALKLQDPKMIAIFTRLGMYEIVKKDGSKDLTKIEKVIAAGYKSNPKQSLKY